MAANNKNNISNKKDSSLSVQEIVMKVLSILGVIVVCIIIIHLCYYFFVKKSDILINMSTDKKVEYIKVNGEDVLVGTQKYVSDLNYSMRYDIEKFRVFKYKNQDIYKNKENERILVVVEKSTSPSNCDVTTLQNEYNNCYVKVDEYTDSYYVTSKKTTYRIMVKYPSNAGLDAPERARVDYMLNSFVIN